MGPPWGQTTRKSHIAHGSDYGDTVNQHVGELVAGARRQFPEEQIVDDEELGCFHLRAMFA
jgi:hypothetical protein